MKRIKSHFRLGRRFGGFSRQERSGIFFLLLAIVLFQGIYLVWNHWVQSDRSPLFSLDEAAQQQVDSLKNRLMAGDTVTIRPFNPNFISDYKGYTLGMSVAEIDRLNQYRSQDKWINSPEEFQKVTLVNDSLLKAIEPYFRFPEWSAGSKERKPRSLQKKSTTSVGNLNTVTADELKKVYGIGDKLSARIVKFRDRLGGFLVNEQLYDVYGLEPAVADRVLQRFQVQEPPQIQPVDINTASKQELVSLIYIDYDLADAILAYRQKNGRIESFDELGAIQGFPKEKIDRIRLYLSL
ncbi:MAG: hypothetical protein CMH48_12370 [Muricauda sp.]|nr:helix-hairpin-helix domain-containing protein [Allomuricauda sp.]MBC31627.1 hypothetical protein [Allomuricauda sp.]